MMFGLPSLFSNLFAFQWGICSRVSSDQWRRPSFLLTLLTVAWVEVRVIHCVKHLLDAHRYELILHKHISWYPRNCGNWNIRGLLFFYWILDRREMKEWQEDKTDTCMPLDLILLCMFWEQTPRSPIPRKHLPLQLILCWTVAVGEKETAFPGCWIFLLLLRLYHIQAFFFPFLW